MKPSIIALLQGEGYDNVIYIDPDVQVFSNFTEVPRGLESVDVVLTPHFFCLTDDTANLMDKDVIRTGIFNLGFIAMKRNNETEEFVKWLDKRVKIHWFAN